MPSSSLKVRLYGDPCLRQKAAAVEEVGAVERLLIGSMIETMHAYKGVGLAAPQVGISRRILVADIGDGPLVMINPEIIKQDGGEVMEEGCLSIPEVTVDVRRSQHILVRYKDERGDETESALDGLMARVIQHETDHLNGKLIVDYASEEDLKKIQPQLEKMEQSQH